MESRRRFALVGTGGRSLMFLDAIANTYRDTTELVALCDSSEARMKWHRDRLAKRYGLAVPAYSHTGFSRMIHETRPDVVIVTTVDAAHASYVVAALEAGCAVICEKPLAIRTDQLRDILGAVDRSRCKLQVALNLRYMPVFGQVNELLRRGVIGKPTAIDLQWSLDTRHGADYFRRWHATREMSGGLLVHKSSHHFDLVNWWLQSRPQSVFAYGRLAFYGQPAARSRGEHYPFERYTGETSAQDDPFALRLDASDGEGVYGPDVLRGLYLEAEHETGYIRDRNVFGTHIDIEDTAAVLVRYESGVVLTYSLVAYAPSEGFRLCITGERGRIELTSRAVSPDSGKGGTHHPFTELSICPQFADPYRVEVVEALGGHGGADPLLMADLFGPDATCDAPDRVASHLDGVWSAVIGISANESIDTGLPVFCTELLSQTK